MPNQIVVRPPFTTRGQWKWIPTRSLSLGSFIGGGGLLVGGTTTTTFTHAGQVASNVEFFWDFDNDGDFSETAEDITSYVMAAETTIGRDWPSQINGKSGPGRMRLTLNNQDGRFSYFNTSSPLATAPNSLRTGRKIRVQVAETASDPDPALLIQDRFNRSNGTLGTAETGQSWSTPAGSPNNPFTITSQQARPTVQDTTFSIAQANMVLIDAGTANYYAQATLTNIGSGDRLSADVLGIVFRYQDANNFSVLYMDNLDFTLSILNRVAGSYSFTDVNTIDPADGMTIGIHASGATATLYWNGVPIDTGTALQTDETRVGLFCWWQYDANVLPAFDDFYVWDDIPQTVQGVLWTGDVSDLSETVVPGPQKTAVVSGEGRLARLSNQTVTIENSATGHKTGAIIGEILAQSNALYPPGQIDGGDVTTGAYAFGDVNALNAARDVEETEFGFLRESQEGYVEFDARSARSGSSSVAAFGDRDVDQFHFTGIEPLNWSREITNRVVAGVSPSLPSGFSSDVFTTDGSGLTTTLDIPMPATVNAGDLLIVAVAFQTPTPVDTLLWVTPANWTEVTLRSQQTLADTESISSLTQNLKIWAKKADGTEDGDVLTFVTGTNFAAGNDSAVAEIIRITDWYGDVDKAIEVSEYSPTLDPEAVFPSWGPDPSRLMVFYWTVYTGTLNGFGPSSRYNLQEDIAGFEFPPDAVNGASKIQMWSGYRNAAVEVENANAGTTDYTAGAAFEASVCVAVRGPDASSVQVDDTDSQDEHNTVITHTAPGELFANETDATTYGNLVLSTYADDRPIIRLTFIATKSPAYRYQAITRRINDRITVIATENSNLGIFGDFFIESISHRWSNGNTLWETTWELSPAD